MANFSTSDMGAPSGSPFSPSRPQVDETPSQILNVLGSALEIGGEIKKNQANAQANSVLTQFTQENLKLAEAVDQGLMTSQEARMRGRKTFSQFVANNPGLYDDLTSRQSDIFDQAGLGKVIAEGTDVEQAGISLQKEAIGAGWVRADASPQQIAEATANYADFKRANEEFNAMKSRVTFENAQESHDISTTTQRFSHQQALLQEKSRKALFNLSSSYTPKFRSDMDGVIERLQTGEVSEEEAVREAQMLWSQVQTTVNQVGDRAGSEHISNLSAPMKSMYENTVAHIKGDLSLDILNTQNEKVIALAQKNWLSDPKMAAIVAGDRLIRNSDLLSHAQLEYEVLQHLRRNGFADGKPADLLTDDPDERRNLDTTLKILKQNMNVSTRQGLDEETEGQLSNNISGVLRGVQAYGPNTTKASEYQQVVDFLASPEFGSYTTKKGGIPADVAANASQVLQEQYEQVVLPLLREEYETGAVASGLGFSTTGLPNPTRTTQNVSSAIKPVFRGGGVSFQVEGEQGPTSTAGTKARALNKRVSPILNRLIRMAAHLEGHQDYRKVYEDRYVSIFGEEDQEEGNE